MTTLTRPLDWPDGEVIGDDDGDTMWVPVANRENPDGKRDAGRVTRFLEG